MLSRDHALNQAEILAYAKDQGVPIVDVQPACYMENFTGMMLPRKVSPALFPPGLRYSSCALLLIEGNSSANPSLCYPVSL
jgi:hypothetical protein